MSTALISSRPEAPDAAEDIVAEFTSLQPRLLSIAHRILGDRAAAEDVVQDAWIRWQRYDRASVVNPTAFLVATTTRLALNCASSARARHEHSVGGWVVDPVDPGADPTHAVERHESLEAGVARLLGRLGTAERAAFVLRQAFDYPYPQIAEVIGTSEINARQLVSRAAKHLSRRRSRPVDSSDQRGLVRAIVAAARHGNVAMLEQALVPATGRTAAHVAETELRDLHDGSLRRSAWRCVTQPTLSRS